MRAPHQVLVKRFQHYFNKNNNNEVNADYAKLDAIHLQAVENENENATVLCWSEDVPPKVIRNILLFVGDPQQVLGCMRLCKSFYQATNGCPQELFWRELACQRYGPELAKQSSLKLYQEDWKAMVLDDNRQGALPTLTTGFPKYKTCSDRLNQGQVQRSCLIERIQWNRDVSKIHLYLTVQGENCPIGGKEKTFFILRYDGMDGEYLGTIATVRPPTVQVKTTGNSSTLKGCFSFAQPELQQPGLYTLGGAYLDEILLWRVPAEGRLEAVFRRDGGVHYTPSPLLRNF